MKYRGILPVLVLAFGFVSAIRAEDSGNAYRANAGLVNITPENYSFMGGYRTDPPRVAESAHDDLYAYCIVLEGADHKRVIFISLDLVAFLRHDVELIKSKLKEKGVDVSALFISTTHTHSGPDTVGIWGGRDEKYMETLRGKITELVLKTGSDLKNAEVYVAQTSGAGLNRNDKPSGLDDKITTLFIMEADARKMVGVLVNFGCHPETVGKDIKEYSGDFPGALSRKIGKMFGVPLMFVNGSLGGMVTVNPNILNHKTKGYDQTTEFAHRLAVKVFPEDVCEKDYHRLTNKVTVVTAGLSLALENKALEEAMEKGKIPSTPTTYENSTVYAEVSVVTLGDFKMAMFPGEPTPDIGNTVRNIIGHGGPVEPAIFALTNGEIGYIISSESYNLPCFEQEREKSLGRKTGDTILEAFKKLTPVK